ncbi:N-acetyltransferase family protein [Mesorhizobium sp. BR1-1-16]|uniref:GNAT family N-acetyltransferase n=1 Tax=Mesorhizobium sp. BR1-1-16 TaxID=2876653 RepID=UPI001CCB1BD1|nr:GNAT family N-acetyltransferase [Mesorhizobium sp. BR1-1-16]MBZ9939365.1 N-acetyltransferase family protein [Mesorhizobium sp. BR1-1-16]
MPSLPRFSIRPVADADLAAITAIYGAAVIEGTASFELDPPSLDEMGRRCTALLAGGHPYLVAISDTDAVLGYAYAGPYRARPAYRWTVEDSIYLAAEARGAGVGRALLAALLATATEAGYRQMIAVIGDSGNAASIALHRALGFRLVGTFENVGFKHGRWLDSVLMQCALGSGATVPPP